MWYDIFITFFILGFLVLTIASKVTKQKIPEMVRGFVELIRDYSEEKKEEMFESYL